MRLVIWSTIRARCRESIKNFVRSRVYSLSGMCKRPEKRNGRLQRGIASTHTVKQYLWKRNANWRFSQRKKKKKKQVKKLRKFQTNLLLGLIKRKVRVGGAQSFLFHQNSRTPVYFSCENSQILVTGKREFHAAQTPTVTVFRFEPTDTRHSRLFYHRISSNGTSRVRFECRCVSIVKHVRDVTSYTGIRDWKVMTQVRAKIRPIWPSFRVLVTRMRAPGDQSVSTSRLDPSF